MKQVCRGKISITQASTTETIWICSRECGPRGYCIPPCGFGFTLTVLAPLAKLRCRHQALGGMPHGSWSIPPRPPIPNRLRPGLSRMTWLYSFWPISIQPPFTQKAMFRYKAANGSSTGLELLTESWSVFMVNQSSESAPPLERVKRISYTADAESMLLRLPETNQQERR